jgi:heme-degrading monooxygenase HmoA
MIVVSNRVNIPDDHTDVFIERLQERRGIEDQPGFLGLKVLEPIDADEFVTMTFWDSLEEYESWRDGDAFEQAHSNRSAEEVFEEPNTVEVHEVVVDNST